MNRRVDIGDLQQNLAEYMESAKRGQTIEIFDGATLIARIEPASFGTDETFRKELETGEDGVTVRRATGSIRDFVFPPPLKTSVDIVDLLLEERGDR
ncbi:MAG: Antitoxin [Acidobacteria bacterium]|nr:Antitoxin [Acidobacteriota bacterium]